MADILLDDRVVSPHHVAQQEISTHRAFLPPLYTQRPAEKHTPRGPDVFGDKLKATPDRIIFVYQAEMLSRFLARFSASERPRALRYPSTSSNVNNAGSQKSHGEAFRVTQRRTAALRRAVAVRRMQHQRQRTP
jgi:hypothetical protein